MDLYWLDLEISQRVARFYTSAKRRTLKITILSNSGFWKIDEELETIYVEKTYII
jgi:hypothetical protein